MNSKSLLDRDELQQLLGACRERILQLDRLVIEQKMEWESDATEWRRQQRHRRDLAEWLIDGATNEHGRLVKSQIDAGLGGESFVPCSFAFTANGRRYRLELVSTIYEIKEADED